jgi:hypothetical protein
MSIREIAAPDAWSRVVPVSARTGMPLLRRDRRPAEPRRLDPAAAAVVSALAVVLAGLVLLLL